MTERINILVVDDHALFRRGLVGLLLEVPEFNLIGEASTGREAVELSRRLEPDVVLMDVRMPDGSGVEALRVLKQELGVRVLMLTISSKNEDLMAAIEAGADGYLLKSMQPDELFWAIRQVVAGQAVLSPEITAAVMRAAARARKPQPHVSLSPWLDH
jgi:two-component system, NarL family, nitrate/nitrite response regulator NarL